MKISTARLKQIIKEELFYREFHRTTEELTEVESEKQRRYMCAMKDSDDRPEGLSKAEAEEMCTGPMKEASPAHPRGWEPLPHTPSEAGTFLQGLEAEKAIAKQVGSIPPEDRTIAGSQNLDHLDPEGDPEEKFFGDKMDPDEVGLQTMNLTPDQMKRLRELMSRKNK